MIELLFALFGCIIICIFLSDRDKDWSIAYILIGLGLILWTGFRPVGIDNDSPNYYSLFYQPNSESIEYTYYLFSVLLYNLFGDARSIFLFYAILGVSLKMYAFTQLSRLWFLSLLMYVSNFYIMHEVTQIRAGVATGIFLIGLKYLIDNEKKKYLFMVLLSASFHYSAIMFTPLYFLSNKVIGKRGIVIWSLLIPLSYILYFAKVSFLFHLPIPYIQDKIMAYQLLMDYGFLGNEVNALNLVFLAKLLILYFIIWKYDIILKHNANLSILLKLYIISCVCFNALSFFPVLSFRISEIYGVSEILLFPLCYYAIQPKWLANIFVSLLATIILAINIYYNQFIIL